MRSSTNAGAAPSRSFATNRLDFLHNDSRLVVAPEKKEKRRNGDPSNTNVFITVNTNLKPADNSDRARGLKIVGLMGEAMFNSAAGLNAVTAWYDERGWKGRNEIPGADFHDTSLVQSVDTDLKPEIGGAQNSVHLHAVVRVEHTGTLFFDRDRIKNFTRAFFNASGYPMLKKPNVKVKLLGNPNEAYHLRGYLLKDILPGEQVKKE